MTKPTTYAPEGGLLIRNDHSVRLLRDHLRKSTRPNPSAKTLRKDQYYLEAWNEYIKYTKGNVAKFHGPVDLWNELTWLFECLDFPEDAALCRRRVSFRRHQTMQQCELRASKEGS